MLTIIDIQAYSPHEYNIVALPSEEFKRQIISVQNQLVRMLGDAIWLTPPDALHVTVMEITGPHTQPVGQREGRYMQWQRQYGQIVKDTLTKSSAVTLHFNQILVSQRAIIIKATDPAPLNAIRDDLLAKTKLPEGTQPPPDIAHISLARFSRAIDLDKTAQAVRAVEIDYTESIRSLALLQDITPPDFQIITIDTYPLSV